MYRFSSKLQNATDWRVDADGFLRITMCVLKSGVFNYAKKDLPEEITKIKPELDVWRVRIPDGSFSTDFLKSAEGRPLIAFKHEWQDVNTFDPTDIKGALAGSAIVAGGAMVIDGVVNDADTITAITSGELQELSAGYHSTVDVLENDPEADAIQIPTVMNHVVLLPLGRGRCGPSVRIMNEKGTAMKWKVTNSVGEYEFENEDDSKVAEAMVKDVETKNAADMEVKNHELADAKAKFGDIEKAMQALDAEKKILEDRIKQYESEEYQEAQMMERQAYMTNEKTVIENGCDDASKTELDAKLQNAKTLGDRMRVVTAHICNSKGIDYSDDNAKMLFGVLTKTLNKASVTEVRKPVQSKVNNADDKKHPIFVR